MRMRTRHRIFLFVAAAVLPALSAPGDAAAFYGYGDSPAFSLNTAIVSGAGESGLPRAHLLGICFPNPFNPATWIAFELARPEVVDLAVYDLKGRLVRRLAGGQVVAAGPHRVLWDGRDEGGRGVAAGVYVYRLRAGAYTAARSMTLLK